MTMWGYYYSAQHTPIFSHHPASTSLDGTYREIESSLILHLLLVLFANVPSFCFQFQKESEKGLFEIMEMAYQNTDNPFNTFAPCAL